MQEYVTMLLSAEDSASDVGAKMISEGLLRTERRRDRKLAKLVCLSFEFWIAGKCESEESGLCGTKALCVVCPAIQSSVCLDLTNEYTEYCRVVEGEKSCLPKVTKWNLSH